MEPRGELLHVKAPRGTLTPELRAELLRHKPELLATLQRPPSLEQRILAALEDGSRLRSRQIAERCGVSLDTGNAAAPLRLLPGRALFDALARLLDTGEVATGPDGCFRVLREAIR